MMVPRTQVVINASNSFLGSFLRRGSGCIFDVNVNRDGQSTLSTEGYVYIFVLFVICTTVTADKEAVPFLREGL